MNKCNELGIDLRLYIRYVDDSNLAVIALELGTRFEDNRLVIRPELIEEDKKVERDKLTADILKKIANTIAEMIIMEEDVCSNYKDKKIPILDLKVWVESEEQVFIRHEFFKKTMANKTTLRAQTAYPNSQMRAIMVEEVLRRLRNCHPDMPWEARGKHITTFANEMKCSGHTERFRETVIRKATHKFVKQLKEHSDKIKDIYRSREVREKDIMKRGGKNSSDSWYKRKVVKGQTPTSVLRVPYTTKSRLKTLTQNTIEKMKSPHGTKMAIVEGGGVKLKNLLFKPDPFPKEKCDKVDCDMRDCKGRCYQGHVNYSIVCNSCRENDDKIRKVYMGESSRGCYVRGRQHRDDYKNRKGFMWDHDLKEHGGTSDVRFEMELVAKDRDPMRRVIRESIRIRNARKNEKQADVNGRVTEIMNRKEEWFGLKTIEVNFSQD